MDKFLGILTYEYSSKGSKSEGYMPYLTIGDESDTTVYKLYREGVLSLNDNYFEPFDKQQVEVEGRIVMESWIEVKSMAAIVDVECEVVEDREVIIN